MLLKIETTNRISEYKHHMNLNIYDLHIFVQVKFQFMSTFTALLHNIAWDRAYESAIMNLIC